MISILMNHKEFRGKYDVTLYFRSSRAYNMGMSARLKSLESTKSLPLIALRRSKLPLIVRDNIFFRVALRMIATVLLPATYLVNAVILYVNFLSTDRDVIIINNGGYPGAPSCLQAAVIARLIGFRKIIMVVNNIAQSPKGVFKSLSKLYDTVVFGAIDNIITGSKVTGLALRDARRTEDTKLLVVPNGISMERFETVHVTDRRSKIFNRGQVIHFSIIGLHELRKGHLVLLEALKMLISRRADLCDRIMVNIEGHGDLTRSLMTFVNENNLSSLVDFHGHVDNISKFYKDTDVLVHPSLFSEDLPNVISEAMLFGIPTIGSNIAGIPSQISDDKNGFLVEPGDYSVLSQRMETFLDKPEVLKYMSNECVAKFDMDYHSDVAVSRYIDLIEEKI
ncbi:glycosyltransferase family 4 protein [Gammaproteobacteria bacterium]|nr:glycosyltransferase family 4 protein [Gammaproteobacteria bacterium]